MKVTWHSDGDLQCVILAGMGMSTQYIMAVTGLSAGQIAYRLRKAGVYRRDYRNGTSEVAQRMLAARPKSGKLIRSIFELE